jgi:hypothetical protein
VAFGLNDLINDISASVEGLVADLTGQSKQVISYHQGDAEFKTLQSQINQSNWSKLSFPYTFAVVNLTNPADNGGFSDFQLPLAPQAINQKEQPAITVKPSQGGTTVKHGGMSYGQLLISGTTGIAPFRGDGGVSKKTGEAIFQPKDLKHKSGFEVFLHLRNWFRTYYQWKAKKGKLATEYRLVFKNYKDGEFLIIELEDFEMDRQAAKSFLYDYKLSFHILSHFQVTTPTTESNFLTDIDSIIESALEKINYARGVFLRTQGILRQIESTYNASILEPMRQTTLAIKALLGVPLVAADIGSRTIVNTVSTAAALLITSREALNFATLGATGNSQTLDEISGLLDKRLFGTKSTLKKTFDAATSEIKQKGSSGLMKLGALAMKMDSGQFPEKTIQDTIIEQQRAQELPRSFYEENIESLRRVKNNAEDFFNLGSPTYDSIFNRTATLNSDSSKVVTNDEYDILNAFNEAIIGISMLLSTTDLFKSSFDERIQDMVNRFDGQIRLVANQAVKQVKILKGMTLERLAQQELGDSTRWGEIVEVNNLKPPYISDDPQESRDGVLKPTDNILVPVPIVNGFSQVPAGKENKLTVGMSELEKSLGTDFKLNKDFDLVLNSSGDIELVAGAQNMAQSTLLKLSFEPGDVIRHPSIGAGLVVGTKFPPIEEIKDRITNTLLQDTRVQKVADLSLIRDGSALYIFFNLHIKQIDIPVPVKIRVR